jgi:hypothetical protein
MVAESSAEEISSINPCTSECCTLVTTFSKFVFREDSQADRRLFQDFDSELQQSQSGRHARAEPITGCYFFRRDGIVM